jgi:hypothetical protein
LLDGAGDVDKVNGEYSGGEYYSAFILHPSSFIFLS